MPGQTPNKAFDAYARTLKAVLGCITREVLLKRIIPKMEDENGSALQQFFFVKDPVRLRGSNLALHFSQYFRVVWSTTAYKIKTEAYTYEIEDANSGHELLAFHWEPNAPNSKTLLPHMHLGFVLKDEELLIDNKAHIPTGRVPVEDVVSFLISEFEVVPLNPEWEKIIREKRYAFMSSKSW